MGSCSAADFALCSSTFNGGEAKNTGNPLIRGKADHLFSKYVPGQCNDKTTRKLIWTNSNMCFVFGKTFKYTNK